MSIRLTNKTLLQALLRACFVVLFVVAAVAGLGANNANATAGTPAIINYQARLTNAAGLPITTATNMRFVIWDSLSGGSCVWSGWGTGSNGCTTPNASQVSITPVNGVFSVPLGDTTYSSQNALQNTIFNDDSRYLEIQVYNGASYETLSPRKRILSAPYAFNSNMLNGLSSSASGPTSAAIVATNGSGLVTVGGGATVTGGIITLTANGASTWSTSSGALTIDSAAVLNLGTTNATSISIGNTSGATAVNINAGTGNINMTGFVGIGTSSTPAQTLEVNGSAQVDTNLLVNGYIANSVNSNFTGIGTGLNGITFGSGTIGSVFVFNDIAGAKEAIGTAGYNFTLYKQRSTDSTYYQTFQIVGGSAGSVGATGYNFNIGSSTAVAINSSGSMGIANTSPSALLTLGTAGTTLGTLSLAGSTSGTVTVQPGTAAGTWTLTLPTTAGTVNQVLQTNGSGVTTWATVSGSAPSLNSITSATNTTTLTNANFAQVWNWGTLTTQTGMTFGGGSAMTTGKVLQVGMGTYVHTTAETGELLTVTSTDASTIASGISTTNTIDAEMTINSTSGAGTKIMNAFSSDAPTLTACAAGTCTYNAYTATLQSTGAAATITQNGINVTGASIAAGTENGINIGNITAGAGTENAINIGTGWDAGINGAGVLTINSNGNLLLNPSNTNYVGVGNAAPNSLFTIGPNIPTGAPFGLALSGNGTNLGTIGIQNTNTNGFSGANLYDSSGALAASFQYGNSGVGALANTFFFGNRGSGSTVVVGGGSATVLLTIANNGSVTFASTNATGTTTSSAYVFNGSALTSGTLMRLTSSSTSGRMIDMNLTNTSGTIFNNAYGAAATMAGALIGEEWDLSTNVTMPAAGQSLTAIDMKLPAATTTSNAAVYTGLNLSTAGAISNSTAGSIIWNGAAITMPNLTQGASGSVTSSGVKITNGTMTTAGTQNGILITTNATNAGTQNGVSLTASGVSAGTLNGINIGGITAGAGTENAINIGTGWDNGIYSPGAITINANASNSNIILNPAIGTGFVGIGTSSPGALLSMAATNSQYINMSSTAGGATAVGLQMSTWNGHTGPMVTILTQDDGASSGYLRIQTSSGASGTLTDRMTITAAGVINYPTTATVMNFASTAANTFLWQLPSSTSCTSGASQGIRIFEGGNTTTQRGHICINSGSSNQLTFFAQNFTGTSTDVAENYSSDPAENLQPGDMIAFDPNGGLMVHKAVANGPLPIGAISTSPGVTLSGIDDGTGKGDTTHPTLVALVGRVPVKVSNENGAIAVGDPITVSSVAGIGAKQVKVGRIIGFALDAYDSATPGMIRVFIQPGWNDPTYAPGSNINNASNPIISNGAPSTIATSTPKDNSVSNITAVSSLTVTGDLSLAGFSINNILSLHGVNGNWSIDQNGVLTQMVKNQDNHNNPSLFASTMQNATVTLFGSGKLVSGTAQIVFTAEQKEVMAASQPYNVTVTLTDAAKGIYVASKTADGFFVDELNGGTSGATFDWTVIARRVGYENTNDFGLTPDQLAPVAVVPTPEPVVTTPTTPAPEPTLAAGQTNDQGSTTNTTPVTTNTTPTATLPTPTPIPTTNTTSDVNSATAATPVATTPATTDTTTSSIAATTTTSGN